MLRKALIAQAEEHFDVILPGYTHLQHAQPVLFSHHMLAYVWMLTRDFERLAAARRAADASPLGSAALAGTTYPLDRQMTADDLGFSNVIPNSLDAVSDRDFLLDLSYACSVSCMHLSRLCEEIVLWSTSEFDFIELSDDYGIAELETHAAWAGSTLIDLDFRKKYGLNIIAIRSGESEVNINPLPGDRINAGDVLVVIGSEDQISKLERSEQK